jgi:predicted RNase H-like nuclease (RuvC/YqgF family)
LPSPHVTSQGERQSPKLEDPCESASGASALSGTFSSPPILPYTVVEEENTSVYELAAYRTPTETLSSQTRNEANLSDQDIRNDEPDSRTDRQSFEEELKRLSEENERQQVHIYDLVARVHVAERKAQELAGGSRLTRHRKLRIRISKLIEELQVKETEVQEWVARYSSAVQKAQISRDGEGRELVKAIQAIKEGMEASMQNLCGYLENKVQDVEQKEMILDRRAKGMRLYWSEEHFDTALLR